jgi:hypothetical protein
MADWSYLFTDRALTDGKARTSAGRANAPAAERAAFSLSFRSAAMFNLCPFEVEAISQMPAAASGDGAREEQNYE